MPSTLEHLIKFLLLIIRMVRLPRGWRSSDEMDHVMLDTQSRLLVRCEYKASRLWLSVVAHVSRRDSSSELEDPVGSNRVSECQLIL